MKKYKKEAEARYGNHANNYVDRKKGYIAGYKSCLKNLKKWLKENTDEHIYVFIESECEE